MARMNFRFTRRYELATLLAEDLTIKQAAARMGIAYPTAREYVSDLKVMCSCATLGGLLLKMERWGLFDPGPPREEPPW